MSRRSQVSSTQLLERLRTQFPELSHDEVAHAAAGVAALPTPRPAEPEVRHTPRHRA